MRLSFAGDRVLAVVAHPDDAELLCAGTLARARLDLAEVGVCVLCRGDKGQPQQPVKDLTAARRREMAEAAEKLPATLFRTDYADGTLSDAPRPRARLIEIFRQFRPSLVLAHAPEDYHPDHRAASALTESVTWFAASRGHVTRSEPLEAPPALWWMDCVNTSGFEPGFFIDVSDFAALKEEMLACHQSQTQRGEDEDVAPLVQLMRRQMRTRGAEAGVAAAEAFRLHYAFKRVPAW